MNDDIFINPADAERVLWRHSGTRPISKTALNESQSRVFRKQIWAARIVMLAPAVALLLFHPENLQYINSPSGLVFIFVLLFLLSMIPKFIKFFRGRIQTKKSFYGAPVWMSERRLVYSAYGWGAEQQLLLSDIQQSELGYEMGSLAFIVKSPKASIKLISSEVQNLQNQLYILRPDLEQAS